MSLRSIAILPVASLMAGLVLTVGPVSPVRAETTISTFTGAPGFPELGGPGEVLSIDAWTTSALGGTGTYTPLRDLVVEESRANQIAELSEDGTSFGSTFHVEAPAPFAWLPGSGSVSIKRADDPSADCVVLHATLTVSTSSIDVAFQRTATTDRCVVRVSGIKVIPTAPLPLVSAALLQNLGSSPGMPSIVGVLALTTSQGGGTPKISLSASSKVITWFDSTVLTATIAARGANWNLRFEQSLNGVVWTAADVVTTNLRGVATFPMQPRFNRFYRVVFVGGSGLSASVSNVAHVFVRFKATLSPLRATATTIRRGTAITFTTTVKPVVSYFQIPTVEFRLYHRTLSGWKLVKTTLVRTNALGRAAWRPTFAVRGDWYVRSRVLQTGANATSVLTPIARYAVR